MRVTKRVGRWRGHRLAIGGDCRGDEMQKRVRGGFVVAAGGAFGDLIGGVVGFDAFTQKRKCFIEWVGEEIKIGNFHVRAVGPLRKGKGEILELFEEQCVVHKRPNQPAGQKITSAGLSAQKSHFYNLDRRSGVKLSYSLPKVY